MDTADAAFQMARDKAGKIEQLLRVSVRVFLGDNILLVNDEALAARLRRVQVQGQEYDTWTLDGKPFLELRPPYVETVNDGETIKLVCTQKYRRLTDGDREARK
jgi:hypothetical protein